MLKQHSPAVGNALKTAMRLLVQRLGGYASAELSCRATMSMLSDYGNPDCNRWAPVDVVLDVETVAGQPLVTAALARAQGYELVPVHPHGEGKLPRSLADIGREVGTLFATAADALADGVVTEAERLDLRRDLEALRRVCGEAMAILAMPPIPAPGANDDPGRAGAGGIGLMPPPAWDQPPPARGQARGCSVP